MAHRKHTIPKKVSWSIFAIALIFASGIFYYASSIAPQAAETNADIRITFDGVIKYAASAPANDATEKMSLAYYIHGTEAASLMPLAEFKHGASTQQRTLREYHASVNNAPKGKTYRVTLLPQNCSVEFTIPATYSATRVVVRDRNKISGTPGAMVIPIDTMNVPCVVASPSPSPSPTASVTPTPSPTASVTTSPSPSPSSPLTSSCDTRLDVAYVIDNSGSMDDTVGNATPKSLLNRFVTKAEDKYRSGQDRVGFFTYSYSDGTLAQIMKQDFTVDIAGTHTKVKGLLYGAEGSNIAQGLVVASRNLNEKRRTFETGGAIPGIMLIIGDYQSTTDNRSYTTAKDDYTNKNIRYYTLSLGGGNGALRRIAETAGGKYFAATTSAHIDAAVTAIFKDFNDRYANCLQVRMFTDKQLVREGNQMVITYAYRNDSRRTVTNAKIAHTLPEGVTTLDNATSVSFDLGSLAPNATGTKTVTVKVNR